MRRRTSIALSLKGVGRRVRQRTTGVLPERKAEHIVCRGVCVNSKIASSFPTLVVPFPRYRLCAPAC